MKKNIFFVSIVMFLITFNSKLFGQLLNSSFESWESSNTKLTKSQRESLIIGKYIPNETNTGLLPGYTPDNLEQVVPPTGSYEIKLTEGYYENKIFWGQVNINKVRTGKVTFRNCFFAGCDPDKIPAGYKKNDATLYKYYKETYGLICDDRLITQWEMQDCKFDPSVWFDASIVHPGDYTRTGNMSFMLRSTAGIRGGSGTIKRCEITNVQDGFSIVQWASDIKGDLSFLTIEGCWIHKMIFYKGVGHPQPEGTHSDCIQFHVGRNITIRGNRIGGAYDAFGYEQDPSYNSGDDVKNSGIMLQQEVDSQSINKLLNIVIEENLFEGAKSGAYNINHSPKYNNSFETTQIKNNRFIQRSPAHYVIRPKLWADRYSNNKIVTWKVEGVSINATTTEINYSTGAAPTY